MSIYTKKGDLGMTDLLSGNRTAKDNPYIHLVGQIDETTSQLGLVRVALEQDFANEIQLIQNTLIQIMGVISSQFAKKISLQENISFFENRIDSFQQMFPKLTGFITPGDDEISARLDVARTLVRRCERQLVAMNQEPLYSADIASYFNRLSDYLYAMARMIEFREKVKKALIVDKNFDLISSKTELKNMTAQLAKVIAEKVVQKADEQNLNIVVSIVNRDGAPYLTYRMDDAFVVSFSLARKKAYTAAMLKMPTHELAKLTAKGSEFYGLEGMLDEEIVTMGGGYPISLNGSIIGAIGVSGSSVELDSALASYGATIIEAVITDV